MSDTPISTLAPQRAAIIASDAQALDVARALACLLYTSDAADE